MRVLVHICCGPCAVTVLQRLKAAGYDPVGLFFNPNIHPLAEYLRRREGAAIVADQLGVPLISVDALPFEAQMWDDPWLKGPGLPLPAPGSQGPASLQDLPPAVNPVPWLRAVAGREDRRCVFCWRIRLRKLVALAGAWDFPTVTTSLLYSLYQDHEGIKALGQALAAEAGIGFLHEDFRTSWQEGVNLSRAMGLYRQPYCGCVYSEYDRYAGKGLRVFNAVHPEKPGPGRG